MTRLHFAVSTDMVTWDGARPVCGNDFRHVKILTDDPAQVTCRQCLTLCGFDAAADDQLTVNEPDPIRRAA